LPEYVGPNAGCPSVRERVAVALPGGPNAESSCTLSGGYWLLPSAVVLYSVPSGGLLTRTEKIPDGRLVGENRAAALPAPKRAVNSTAEKPRPAPRTAIPDAAPPASER
jgi:hypothetical protein